MTSGVVRYRPKLSSSLFAIFIALGVVAVLASGFDIWMSLGVQAIGLLLLGFGVYLHRRRHRVLAFLSILVGMTVLVTAFLLVITGGHRTSVFLIVLPGMMGALVLAIGLFVGGETGSRGMVDAGAAGVFLSVIAAGLFQASPTTILAAGVGTVLVWDAGEQAINLGEQLGTASRTRSIEALHLSATALVGAIVVLLGVVLVQFAPGGLSLLQFALLIVAFVLLTLALHE